MNTRRLLNLFAATALAVSIGAAAVSAQDARTTYGHGEASCRSFVTAWHHMNNPLLKSYITWLDGYMTARSKLLR